MAIIAGSSVAVVNLAISAVYFVSTGRSTCGRRSARSVLNLDTVSATDGATADPDPGHPALGATCSASSPSRRRCSRPDRSASLACLLGLLAFATRSTCSTPRTRAPSSRATTTSRRAPWSSSAASRTPAHQRTTGPASPAPFRFPTARSRGSARGAAGTPRSAAGRTPRPGGSRGARRSRRAARPRAAGRCSAASRHQVDRARRGPRASAGRAGSTPRRSTRGRPAVASAPSSRWSRTSSSARPSAPEQQRLVDSLEPGDRRAVVEVGGVGGGQHRRRVEEDGHRGRSLALARAGGRPRVGRSTGRRATAARARCARCRGTGTRASPRARRATSRRPPR